MKATITTRQGDTLTAEPKMERFGPSERLDRMMRYDRHRPAARLKKQVPAPLMADELATLRRERCGGPMATRPAEAPPARYEVEDFDQLAPARGIVLTLIIVAFVAFVAALLAAN